MSASDSNKLVVLLTHNSSHDTASVGFTIANAALSQGKEVAIFLTADGVDLARQGASDLAHVRPFKPLDDLIEQFTGQGGIVWACSPCFQNRGHRVEDNLAGVTVTGAGPMLEWLDQGASTVCL
ncbi:MAG: DsrE family protein [Myxococcota bacterium]